MGPVVLDHDLPLTSACKHYTRPSEVPSHLKKYFYQRCNLWTNYDPADTRMTDDAWFGVTPEPVAHKIAADLPASPSYPPLPLSARNALVDPPKAGDGASSSDGKKRKRDDAEQDDVRPASTLRSGSEEDIVIVDLFAGSGGNTTAFALSGRWARVIGIEKEAATMACAQHNAKVQMVEEGAITWLHGDCFEFLAALREEFGIASLPPAKRSKTDGNWGEEKKESPSLKETNPELHALLRTLSPRSIVLFASPPWGGVSYNLVDVFDLSTMQPYNLAQLYESCAPFGQALFLPRSSDLRQLAALVPGSDHSSDDDDDRTGMAKRIDVVQYCIEGFSKGLVAYIPPSWSGEAVMHPGWEVGEE